MDIGELLELFESLLRQEREAVRASDVDRMQSVLGRKSQLLEQLNTVAEAMNLHSGQLNMSVRERELLQVCIAENRAVSRLTSRMQGSINDCLLLLQEQVQVGTAVTYERTGAVSTSGQKRLLGSA